MLNSIQIITETPIWFTIFCVLIGFGYSFVLYQKEDRFKELPKWKVRLMWFLRWILVTILAFLLLSPFIKTLFNKVDKPVIIIVQDNSSSILLNKDSTYYKSKYLQELQDLRKSLEKDYEVKMFVFGNDVVEDNTIDYTQKITNIANVFDEVNNKFYNRNVGALILASDGIFNQGANPVFNSSITNFPVYAIALGDTTTPKDIILKEVIHNKITFLGNQFPLEIYAETKQLKGEKTELLVTNNGKKLFTKAYTFSSHQTTINETILLEANEIGVQHYRISLSTVKEEISTINNTKDVYVEVLDGRQNILILANAPHPDIKALKLSIESNENYKVTSQFFDDFDGNVTPYSLLIVHQIPNNNYTLLKSLNEKNISILYVLGSQTIAQKFNDLNVGLSIKNSRNKFNLVLPEVVETFPLFTLSKKTMKMINSFPPLLGPFGNYQINTNSYPLLNQKIGSVVTEQPLMIFFQTEHKKVAVIAGEGIWKWRMQNYMESNNHNAFNEFINKTVQFLSVKEDKSKFRVITKDLFLENEEIILNAELYNDSYELINDPEITINLKDEDGNNYSFIFSKTSTAYLLNSGVLPIGFYNYTASVKWGKKEYRETGKFQINPILLEANTTVANHQLLQNIVEKHGGELLYPSAINQLNKKIKENNTITSIIYEEENVKELINLKWIFFVLLFLLALEWFLRKRNGAY